MGQRGERKRVDSGVIGTRWVRRIIRNVAKTELSDMNRFDGGVRFGEVVTDDAVRGGITEVIWEQRPPGDI